MEEEEPFKGREELVLVGEAVVKRMDSRVGLWDFDALRRRVTLREV